MGIRDALATRLMDPATVRAIGELRSASFGAIAPGREPRAPRWTKATPDNMSKDAAEKLAIVFRCIGVTSNSFASGILRYRDIDSNGMERRLDTDPLAALLRRPNPQMRMNRFLGVVAMMAATSGFCVIEKERDFANRVIGLYPLESYRLTAILQNRSAPRWEYRVPGIQQPFNIKPENAIVFTFADRADLSPYGIGPLETCFREAGLNNTMTDFLKAFFDRGAVPFHGALIDREKDEPRLTKTETEKVRKAWRERFGGLMKAVDIAILEGVKDIKRLGFNLNELAYMDLRNINDAAICLAFGVSPMLIDAMIGLENSTYSNKEDARKGFYLDVISGLWDRFDDALTLGLENDFDFSGARELIIDSSKVRALQESRDERAKWVIPAMTGGAITVHTGHRELGIAPPPGADFYIRRLIDTEVPASKPIQDSAAADGATGATGARASARVIDAKFELRLGPRETRRAIGALNRTLYLRCADQAEPWIAGYLRGLGSRVMAEWNRSVDVAARGTLISLETRELSNALWEGEAAFLEEQLSRLMTLNGETAFSTAGEQLGLTSLAFDLADPYTQNVRELLALSVTRINAESRTTIQTKISDGLTAGKSIPQLTKDLQKTFDEWPEWRAKMIARTESMLSYGYSSTSAYRASGLVDRVELLDNPSHRDPYGAEDGLTCAERDGIIAPLEDAEKHIRSEHPNGSLSVSPVLIGDV